MSNLINTYNLIAHRGLTERALENTESSFTDALADDRVWGIEIDVQMTKDNVLVLCNYSTLADISNLDKKLSELTYEEISKIAIKHNIKRSLIAKTDYHEYNQMVKKLVEKWENTEDKIPTLNTILKIATAAKTKKPIFIEIKDNVHVGYQNTYATLLLEATKGELDIRFISRYPNILISMKELNPKGKYYSLLGWTEDEVNAGVMFSKENDLSGYSVGANWLAHEVGGKTVVEHIAESGKELNVWTINELHAATGYDKTIEILNSTIIDPEKISLTTDLVSVIYSYQQSFSNED